MTHRFGRRRRTGSVVTIYGGAGWDTANRLGGALGGTYRGNVAGHTIACALRMHSGEANDKAVDYLDTSGKGFDCFMPSSTTMAWRNANTAGNGWFTSAAWTITPDLEKIQLLVMVYTGTTLEAWASDEKVGADVAVNGYTLPSASFRLAVGARQNGSAAIDADIFSWGAWDRAFSNSDVHDLYTAFASTGKLPFGLANEALVMNVGDAVTGASFPSTIEDQIGSNDFSFYAGSAAGIDLVQATL